VSSSTEWKSNYVTVRMFDYQDSTRATQLAERRTEERRGQEAESCKADVVGYLFAHLQVLCVTKKISQCHRSRGIVDCRAGSTCFVNILNAWFP
jgi:hypothetical protein